MNNVKDVSFEKILKMVDATEKELKDWKSKNKSTQARLVKLEKTVANLSNGISEIKELIKSNNSNSSFTYIKSYGNDKVEDSRKIIDDLIYTYNNKPFNEFYEEIKKHAKWMNEHEDLIQTDLDYWDESCYDEENNPFARLISCLLYFDVSLVAHYIAAINRSNIVGTDNYIVSAGINDINDISDWEKTLIDDLGQLVSFVVESGEATEEEPYKHWQVGRLHLTSSIVTYNYKGEDDTVRKLELYWTPESAEAGNLY